MNDGYKEVRIGPKTVEIPEEWDVKKIEDLFKIKAGGDVNEETFSETRDEEHPYPIYANSLENKGLYGYSSGYTYPEDSITITGRGDLGHAVYRNMKFNAIVRLIVLLPKEDVCGRYIAEYINGQINFPRESTGVPQLTRPQVAKGELALPPLPEQRRIAEILSTVDDAIEKTDEAIEKVERLKRGLMQDLLTKGIGHDEFKEVQIGPKVFEIPEEWDVIPFGEVYHKRSHKIKDGEDPIKYVGLEHLETKNIHIIGFDENGRERSSNRGFKEGDILFGKLRPYLEKAAIAPFEGVCSSDIIPIYSNEKSINRYLLYLMHSYIMKSRTISTMEGTNLPRTSWPSISSYEIPLPPLPEQHQISEILSSLDSKIQTEKSYKEKLKIIKKGLMQDLLTGKVRVDSLKLGDKNA